MTQEESKQKIDYAAEEMKKYIADYNLSDYNISIKFKHTFSVTAFAQDISKRLGLDVENTYIAAVVAILHDIARFEQLRLFNCFEDNKTFDHGDYGVKLLFEDGLIEKFGIDEKYYGCISYAIKNHNKYTITPPKTTSDQDFEMHAKIIRDADKLDNFEAMTQGRFGVTGSYGGEGLSPEVKLAMDEGRSFQYKYIKTELDRACGRLSWFYDLHFDCSKQIFLENKYYDAAYEVFKPMLNETDAETFKTITTNLGKNNYNKQTI